MATSAELNARRARLLATLEILEQTPEQGFSEEGSQVQWRKIEEVRKELDWVDRELARKGGGRRRTVARMERNAS